MHCSAVQTATHFLLPVILYTPVPVKTSFELFSFNSLGPFIQIWRLGETHKHALVLIYLLFLLTVPVFIPTAKHGERQPPLPHLVPDPQAFITQGGALRSWLSPCFCRMNMLKSSGLKIPGRGTKHSSPVGRTSAGGTSSPLVPRDSKYHRKCLRPFICVNDSVEHSCIRLHAHGSWEVFS